MYDSAVVVALEFEFEFIPKHKSLLLWNLLFRFAETQSPKLMHEIKAEQNVQNLKKSKCFRKALRVLQILALAALLLLQWEWVWITAEMKWPTFSWSQL